MPDQPPDPTTSARPSISVAVRARGADRIYSDKLILAARAFGVGVVVAVAIAVIIALLGGYYQTLAQTRSSADNVTRAVTDSTARAVQSIDITLTSVAELLRDHAPVPGDPDIATALRQRLAYTPHLREIVITDLNGDVLFDTAGGSGGNSLSDKPYVTAHAGDAQSLFIGITEQGRFLGRTGSGASSAHSLIPMSRAFSGPDGQPAGVVIAAVNPQYFQTLFEAIDLARHGRLSLYRYDGNLLVGNAGTADRMGALHADLPLFRHYLPASEHGIFTGVDDDGIERITSYRATPVWPLVLSVGIPVDEALAPWRRTLLTIGGPIAVVLAAVLALTFLLVRTLVRRAADEETLRLSERVIGTVSNGVAISDAALPDNPIVYVNPAFEQISGYSADEIIGRNARFLHCHDSEQPSLNILRDAIRNGGSANVVLRNYRKDGSLYWNDLSVSAVRDGAGAITHFVGVQRDVTERITFKAELRKSLEETARINGELERFSEILAHHMQEPVRHVVSYLQMLSRHLGRTLDPKAADYMSRAVDGAMRLKVLLREVQFYLSIDRLPEPQYPAQAERALEAALYMNAAAVERSGVTIETVRGSLPQVWIDEKRLAELFSVFIDNAIQYRHPDRAPRIVIVGAGDGVEQHIRIEDNGIGIDPAYFDKIFGVFERLHTLEEHPGTGMGLALARKIVERAGGRIRVESQPGQGSTFIVTLPAGNSPHNPRLADT
jgi:chemotaxis family two-component system sensor kinase Cph1